METPNLSSKKLDSFLNISSEVKVPFQEIIMVDPIRETLDNSLGNNIQGDLESGREPLEEDSVLNDGHMSEF